MTTLESILRYEESGLHVVFGITSRHQIRLLQFSLKPWDESMDVNINHPWNMFDYGYPLVQMNFAGLNRPYEKQGRAYISTAPGVEMVFVDLREKQNEHGLLLEIDQKDESSGAFVTTYLQFYSGLPIARMWNTVRNDGSKEQILTYLSSFAYLGFEKDGQGMYDRRLQVYIPHNGWMKEVQWQKYTMAQLGLAHMQPRRSVYHGSKNVEFTNTGNWSTKNYLPMGYIEDTQADTSLYFQIEHNGSWHWEMGQQSNHLYLNVSGPNEIQSHFYKVLKPGDCFTGVPAAVGVERADFSRAMAALTRYRRRIRRPNADNENLPVIFNDYMNCLFADPTMEKEIPLIEAAAKAGCEYYVIDAGWYAEGSWWDNVGEWLECRKRFPNGVREATDLIRSYGMVPGLWLELEVMGIRCPLVEKVPQDWFFIHHGKPMQDRSRYQLDFSNPEVRAFADGVITRLVEEYGIGYIKMDYNIDAGMGNEREADSPGDGLLRHQRAYLDWLQDTFHRYPDLVIENCSAGGLRTDYAMMAIHSLASSSDQEDCREYSTIAANAPSACTPEQSAVWSYPLKTGDQEEAVFNMVNCLLGRIHQSGHLAQLAPERLALVEEALNTYKSIRADLRVAVPHWPLGLAQAMDEWVCVTEHTDDTAYLSLWRREREGVEPKDEISIPLRSIWDGQKPSSVAMLYPSEALHEHCSWRYNAQECALKVRFTRQDMARIFVIRK